MIAEQEKQGGYLAAIVGYPDAHVRMAHLRLPGAEHVVELFEYLSPDGGAADVEPKNVGASHLCFITNDLAGDYERLQPQECRSSARRSRWTRGSTRAVTLSTSVTRTESRSSSSSRLLALVPAWRR